MAESTDTNTRPIPAAKPHRDRLIIRAWPKIVLMLPTLFMSVLNCVVMKFSDAPAPDAAFGLVHFWGVLFLVVLAINLTILLYDLNLRGFIVVVLLILTLVLGLIVLNKQENLMAMIANVLSIKVYANSAFYFTFSAVLLFNLLIAWVITRFKYWSVEHNEIIIHRGLMQEQERHPTAQARFKLVIEDIVEYGILGAGTLVFSFGDDDTKHELKTVLFAHNKAKRLDELLGRIAVVSH